VISFGVFVPGPNNCAHGRCDNLCNCLGYNAKASPLSEASHCLPSYYGSQCQNTCSNCAAGTCTNSGDCSGYTGNDRDLATQCKSGYYGPQCDFSCYSFFCRNGLCLNNGECATIAKSLVQASAEVLCAACMSLEGAALSSGFDNLAAIVSSKLETLTSFLSMRLGISEAVLLRIGKYGIKGLAAVEYISPVGLLLANSPCDVARVTAELLCGGAATIETGPGVLLVVPACLTFGQGTFGLCSTLVARWATPGTGPLGQIGDWIGNHLSFSQCFGCNSPTGRRRSTSVPVIAAYSPLPWPDRFVAYATADYGAPVLVQQVLMAYSSTVQTTVSVIIGTNDTVSAVQWESCAATGDSSTYTFQVANPNATTCLVSGQSLCIPAAPAAMLANFIATCGRGALYFSPLICVVCQVDGRSVACH
jgi:hypothetical protein